MGSMIKTAYKIAAGLALLHLVALVGVIVFLEATGRLDAERVRRVAAVLRGGEEPSEASAGTGQAVEVGADGDGPSDDPQVADEIRWRNTDRYRAQVEQRLKFINAARVELDRQREEFERRLERERKEREERLAEAGKPGYEKELEIIGQLKPQVALDQLMTMSDAEAARLLFELDTRKAKKIFEAAKTDAQRAKLTTVRTLIRDMQPPEVDGGEARS